MYMIRILYNNSQGRNAAALGQWRVGYMYAHMRVHGYDTETPHFVN